MVVLVSDEVFEAGEKRLGTLTKISPDETAKLLHRIGGDANSILKLTLRPFGWRLEATTFQVVFPAVIGAADPMLLDHPASERSAAVSAPLLDEAELTRSGAEQCELLAKQFDWLWITLKINRGGNRMPKEPHVLAHGRTLAHTRQHRIAVSSGHWRLLLIPG